MSSFRQQMPDLVIPIGTAVSNALTSEGAYGDSSLIGLLGPSALDALDFTIEVTLSDFYDIINGSAVWGALADSTGAAIDAPGASEGRAYTDMLVFSGFRIKASGNVAAARTFKASKLEKD